MGSGYSQDQRLTLDELKEVVDEVIDIRQTSDVLHALSGIRPAHEVVTQLLKETDHQDEVKLTRNQVAKIARVYFSKLAQLVDPRIVRRKDDIIRFAFADGPVGVGVRRSGQGLKIYRCEGPAALCGVQLGYLIVELQGETIPATTHQRAFGSLVSKSPRPLVLGFKDPALLVKRRSFMPSSAWSDPVSFFLCSNNFESTLCAKCNPEDEEDIPQRDQTTPLGDYEE